MKIFPIDNFQKVKIPLIFRSFHKEIVPLHTFLKKYINIYKKCQIYNQPSIIKLKISH